MDPRKDVIPGTIVNYVLKNGESRPFIVTRKKKDTSNLNGVVHFDGPNDQQKLDEEVRSDLLRTGTLWLEDIPYSELRAGTTPTPGTWHFAETMAAAART